ncbi:uncharacterized protein F5Z01DRAFT_629062, partial [Emericellopsis atlantica]
VNPRTATKTTTLPVGGGPEGSTPVLVPRGTTVGYSVYIMHRRKDLYREDADSFCPGRWEGGRLSDVGWGSLPFNGGPGLGWSLAPGLLPSNDQSVRKQSLPPVRGL